MFEKDPEDGWELREDLGMRRTRLRAGGRWATGDAGVRVTLRFPEELGPGRGRWGGRARLCFDFGCKVKRQLGVALLLDSSPYQKGVHETDKKLEGKYTTVICMCKWSQVGDKFIRTFAFEIRPPVMVPELLKPMTSVCETL